MSGILVRFIPNERGNPPGKLADAEVLFTEGQLSGLKLVGFAVWERRSDNGRNVTFPARQYSVNGERRSFSLLRPSEDGAAVAANHVRDFILNAYLQHEAQHEATQHLGTRGERVLEHIRGCDLCQKLLPCTALGDLHRELKRSEELRSLEPVSCGEGARRRLTPDW